MSEQNFLIVGGSSGVGLAIAQLLSDQGNQVWIASRSEPDLGPAASDRLHYLKFDATRDSLPSEQLPDTLHGLVYSAGSIRLKPFTRLSDADFAEDFELNVMGAVRVLRELVERLKVAPQGASVLFFSTVAVQTGMPFHASISAAKGALEGLTRALAAEFAPHIRVNAIALSLTDTPLASRLLATVDKRKMAEERHPLKHIGDPQEVARFAGTLLGEGGRWITGQIIHLDGGLSALRILT